MNLVGRTTNHSRRSPGSEGYCEDATKSGRRQVQLFQIARQFFGAPPPASRRLSCRSEEGPTQTAKAGRRPWGPTREQSGPAGPGDAHVVGPRNRACHIAIGQQDGFAPRPNEPAACVALVGLQLPHQRSAVPISSTVDGFPVAQLGNSATVNSGTSPTCRCDTHKLTFVGPD